jgi:acetoacetate decarboxylase
MNIDEIRRKAFAMPLTSPAFPPGPYRFMRREFLVITYRTDLEALRAVDSTGFGDYTESGQVIPVQLRTARGVEPGAYVHAMYLDDHPPIAGGRELWGFPKKLATPVLDYETDTLVGTLDYGKVRIATATMGFKHRALAPEPILAGIAQPNFLLKIIPHVDGSVRICELVRYYMTDVTLHGAWTGPAALELHPHALAPVADLPVLKVESAVHFIADMTLALGTVEFDYLA